MAMALLGEARTSLLKIFDNNNSIPKPKVLPSDEWKQRLREAMVYTPDAVQLEQSAYQNLFVCDDLMIGHIDHWMLRNAERQATGFTRHNFVFYMRNRVLPLGIPLQAWERGYYRDSDLHGGGTRTARVPGNTYAPIRGEIYAVPSTLFANSLDKFKMNGTMFIRRRVPIVVRGFQEWNRPSGLIREPFQRIVECWMYIAVPDFWNNLIDAGYNYSIVRHYEADRWDSDYGKFVMRRYYWYNEFNSR